jgi:hypothetical protein
MAHSLIRSGATPQLVATPNGFKLAVTGVSEPIDVAHLSDADLDWVIDRVQANDVPGRAKALLYLLLQRDCRGR